MGKLISYSLKLLNCENTGHSFFTILTRDCDSPRSQGLVVSVALEKQECLGSIPAFSKRFPSPPEERKVAGK